MRKMNYCFFSLFFVYSFILCAENSYEPSLSCLDDLEQGIGRPIWNNKWNCRHNKPFKLKDLFGEWIMEVESIGGVLNNNEEARGVSVAIVGQHSIDINGNLIFNDGWRTVYGGEPGNIRVQNIAGLKGTIKLTRPEIGEGTLTLHHSTNEEVIAIFIKRSPNGIADEFVGTRIAVEPPSENNATDIFIARHRRQN